MPDAIDLLTLSRDIARAEEKIARGAPDPFCDLRHVATQSTYRALAESAPPPHEVLVRDASLRWVHELLQTRVGADLASDEAEATEREDARFVADPPSTFLAARRALVVAETPSRTSDALDRLAELAAPVAAVRRERRARRFEVARRLGLAHPSALASAAPPAALEDHARALLDATEEIARELRKQARITSASGAIYQAFAREAAEGWPARLVPRWLTETFAAIAPRAFRLAALPEAVGGASFLRGAAAFGRSLRHAGTARSLPFVLARDPYPTDAHRFGALLALAVASPAFQMRKLGLPTRTAASQTRALMASMLTAAREGAARLLLGAREATDDFEELTARVFAVPLPRALRDAWPAPRVDEPARMVAILSCISFEADLVDRFDEDWFDNPRTGGHLSVLASAPVSSHDAVPTDASVTIGRAFERALG